MKQLASNFAFLVIIYIYFELGCELNRFCDGVHSSEKVVLSSLYSLRRKSHLEMISYVLLLFFICRREKEKRKKYL